MGAISRCVVSRPCRGRLRQKELSYPKVAIPANSAVAQSSRTIAPGVGPTMAGNAQCNNKMKALASATRPQFTKFAHICYKFGQHRPLYQQHRQHSGHVWTNPPRIGPHQPMLVDCGLHLDCRSNCSTTIQYLCKNVGACPGRQWAILGMCGEQLFGNVRVAEFPLPYSASARPIPNADRKYYNKSPGLARQACLPIGASPCNGPVHSRVAMMQG